MTSESIRNVDTSARPRRAAEPGAATLVLDLAWRCLRYGSRKLRYAVERRRMAHVRRSPVGPITALRSAKRILFVCHGNINRSAFAARLVAQAVGGQTSLSVLSAGLEAAPGSLSPPNAVSTAARLGVDLRDHLSAALAPEIVAASHVIFVMEVPQLIAMRRRFPGVGGKTFLLTCLAPDAPLEISDPVDGDESRFQECFDQISRAVRPIIDLLPRAERSPKVESLSRQAS